MFSKYLKKKKEIVKKLIADLGEKYEFASILATDVKGMVYAVDKSSTVIRPSSVSECGFVLRVNTNGLIYEYSFSELTEKNIDEVKKGIEELINKKASSKKVDVTLNKEEEIKKDYVRKSKGKKYSDNEIIDKLKELRDYGFSLDERVLNCQLSFESIEYNKMYISKNKELTQYYTYDNPRCYCLVKDGDNIKYAYDGFGGNNPDEEFVLLKDSIKETVNLAIELLGATMPTPGKYTIITDPSITGLIAHEAFGHGVEMDMFVKDRAKSQEYKNKEVASSLVTMHDGASAAFSSASYFFDDEGVLAQDTVIIDKGILIGGLCDSVSAGILKYHPTGNGRRESFKRKVYTRMTNTFFDKNKDKLEEMIASTEYGYYICATNNGMEDPKNWGIQCTALYGREIVNGKFTGKIVSPVVMSGYVIDLLESIEAVSNTKKIIGSGGCGKGYKEWVRVSDGGASIKATVKIG